MNGERCILIVPDGGGLVEQVQRTKRPVFLTQHGHCGEVAVGLP